MKELCLLLITVTIITANSVPFDSTNCVPLDGCPKADPRNYTVHLPYIDDCHKFYKCTDGKGCLVDCPLYDEKNRLVFNEKEEVCDWPKNVDPLPPNCSIDDSGASDQPTPITPPTGTVTPPTNSPTPPTGTVTPPTNPPTPPTGTVTPPTNSPTPPTDPPTPATNSPTPPTNPPPLATCPSVGTANVRHETDCNYYWHCENGVAVLKKCMEGNVFNPNIESCDLASNYLCETTKPVN